MTSVDKILLTLTNSRLNSFHLERYDNQEYPSVIGLLTERSSRWVNFFCTYPYQCLYNIRLRQKTHPVVRFVFVSSYSFVLREWNFTAFSRFSLSHSTTHKHLFAGGYTYYYIDDIISWRALAGRPEAPLLSLLTLLSCIRRSMCTGTFCTIVHVVFRLPVKYLNKFTSIWWNEVVNRRPISDDLSTRL